MKRGVSVDLRVWAQDEYNTFHYAAEQHGFDLTEGSVWALVGQTQFDVLDELEASGENT